jgi:hypothetical protein
MLKKLSPFHFDVSASEPNIPEHIHRSMQYSIREGALTGIMGVFTGGVVLTGFALALGANAFVIGLIAAIQVGANLLQVRGRFFAPRNLAGGVVLGVAAGKFIAWWNAREIGLAAHGFVVLIFGGVVFGLWATAIINKMYDPPFAKPASQLTFWQSVKIPFRDPNFRISVIRPIRSLDIFEGFQQALHSLFAPAKYVIEKLVERPRQRAKAPKPRRMDKETI